MGETRYFPKQFDLGWIFYNDDNKSVHKETLDGYWEHIRRFGNIDAQKALDNFTNNFSGSVLRAKMNEYSKTLLNMSRVERNRENKLMREVLGEGYSETSGLEFIKHFNEILIGQERFSGALKRVIAGIEKGGKERAPSIEVNFVDYFISTFNKELELYEKDIDQILEKWDEIVEQAIRRTISRMTTEFAPENELYGNPKDYEGLDSYLMQNPDFYNFVRQYMKIDSIKEEVIKIVSGEKNKRNKKQIKINDVFKTENKKGELVRNEKFSRAIGGLVHEFFSGGEIQIGLGDKAKSGVVRSNIGGTDTIALYSASAKINIGEVYERFQQAMDGESQKQIAYRLKDLDRRLDRKKYENLFVIHGSDKLYTMGDSFRSFSKTQKITDIQYLLKETGLGVERFERELIALYLNTTEGAALDKESQKINEGLRVIIAAVAGQLLFSDWFMIGYETGGPSQIHIFDLDGIIIPLSYILEGMSLTMKEFGESGIYNGPITISSFKRGKILYPANQNPRYGDLTETELHNFSEVWKRQREDAKAKATFEIHFMSNFKNIVQQLAKMSGI